MITFQTKIVSYLYKRMITIDVLCKGKKYENKGYSMIKPNWQFKIQIRNKILLI